MLGSGVYSGFEDKLTNSVPDWDIYTLFDVKGTPKKLKRDGADFYIYFAPPLPELLVVFLTGPWGFHGKFGIKFVLESEGPIEKTVGILSKHSKAICSELKWTVSEKKIAKAVQAEGRLIKLVALFEENNSDDLKDLQKHRIPLKENVMNKDYKSSFDCGQVTDTENTPKQKKIKGNGSSHANKKRKRKITSSPFTYAEEVQKSSLEIRDMQREIFDSPNRSSDPQAEGPSSRWGHSMSNLDDSTALLIGGQGDKGQMSKDSIWILSTATKEWYRPRTFNSLNAERRMGHSCTYNSKTKTVYVFGGSLKETWFKDIHCLDIETWQWSHPEVTGKAPTRAYHSATLFLEELLIFGGVYPKPHPQPDGCSNDLIIFNTENNSWYEPIVTGDKPTPRSGHTSSLVHNQLYIFGGWDAPICNNELYILDLGFMDFRKPPTVGSPPSPRTWHSTIISRDESKLIIYGGYNGDSALCDLFAFDFGKATWTLIINGISRSIGRAGHSIISVEDDDRFCKNNKYLVFGGGDNEANFYSDLLEITV